MDRLGTGGAGGACLVLLLVVVNTPPGRQAIEWLTPRLTGDTVRLAGIAGRFPDALRVARVELRDPQGDYATVEDLALDWSPLQLLHRRIVIDRLEAARDRRDADADRVVLRQHGPADAGRPATNCEVARLDVGAALAGAAGCRCTGRLGRDSTSPTDFSGSLEVRQLDGAGSYALDGASRCRPACRPHCT